MIQMSPSLTQMKFWSWKMSCNETSALICLLQGEIELQWWIISKERQCYLTKMQSFNAPNVTAGSTFCTYEKIAFKNWKEHKFSLFTIHKYIIVRSKKQRHCIFRGWTKLSAVKMGGHSHIFTVCIICSKNPGQVIQNKIRIYREPSHWQLYITFLVV